MDLRLHPVELEREQRARQFRCPVCQRPAGQRCVSTFAKAADATVNLSHTGRYRVAWQAGVMPELGWMFKAVA
jgi:hypothetical protein